MPHLPDLLQQFFDLRDYSKANAIQSLLDGGVDYLSLAGGAGSGGVAHLGLNETFTSRKVFSGDAFFTSGKPCFDMEGLGADTTASTDCASFLQIINDAGSTPCHVRFGPGTFLVGAFEHSRPMTWEFDDCTLLRKPGMGLTSTTRGMVCSQGFQPGSWEDGFRVVGHGTVDLNRSAYSDNDPNTFIFALRSEYYFIGPNINIINGSESGCIFRNAGHVESWANFKNIYGIGLEFSGVGTSSDNYTGVGNPSIPTEEHFKIRGHFEDINDGLAGAGNGVGVSFGYGTTATNRAIRGIDVDITAKGCVRPYWAEVNGSGSYTENAEVRVQSLNAIQTCAGYVNSINGRYRVLSYNTGTAAAIASGSDVVPLIQSGTRSDNNTYDVSVYEDRASASDYATGCILVSAGVAGKIANLDATIAANTNQPVPHTAIEVITASQPVVTGSIRARITNPPPPLVGLLLSDLLSTDTTLSSSELSTFPTVTAPDYRIITLDPLGLFGDPEQVKITAHAASATTATMVRGQRGTTARSHTAANFTSTTTSPAWNRTTIGIKQRAGIGVFGAMPSFIGFGTDMMPNGNNWTGFGAGGGLALAASLIQRTSGKGMRQDTADGSDTKSVSITGGGDYGDSRGATVTAYGNENSGLPGHLLLQSGNAAGAALQMDVLGNQVYFSDVNGSVVGRSGGKISFLGGTPAAKPSALTQTYSTADRTLSAYTSNPESSAYTGAADGEAKLADLNSLRVAYENLRVFTEDLAQFVNALVDDLQAYNLEG